MMMTVKKKETAVPDNSTHISDTTITMLVFPKETEQAMTALANAIAENAKAAGILAAAFSNRNMYGDMTGIKIGEQQ